MRLEMACVEIIKFFEIHFFAIKNLYYCHTRNIFLQIGINSGNSGSNVPIGIPNTFSDKKRDIRQYWHNRERDQSQFPVYTDHHDNDAK